jgi:putative ABC transport system permease protein
VNWRPRPAGPYLWLALLTFLAVFAATAGTREALATRSEAVRQTVAATTPTTRTITVSAPWHDVQSILAVVNETGDPTTAPPATIDAITASLHADFNRAPVSLAPAGADWSSMTVPFSPVNGDLPGTGGTPVKVEITERQPLGSQVRLLSGRLPAATRAAATLQVVVTRQTAATLGLHAGSEFVMPGSERASTGTITQITVLVTGIVIPVDPDSSFWGADPGTLAAHLQYQGSPPSPYWAAGVIAGPDELGQLQSYFGARNPRLEWVFPLDVSSLQEQQVQPLSDALDKIVAQTPTLSGSLEPVSATLTASSDMLFSLNLFIATAQSVDTVLWLLYVSLTVAGLTVLLLAARMVALRRSAEIRVIRARGGSLRQIAVSAALDAALLCVPAAVIAVALAIVVVPRAGSAQGAGSAGGWWPPIAVVAAAVLGPALIAAWQHRLRRRTTSRVPQGGTRLVMEAALVAAAVAGIVVFRDQSAPAGSGVNVYASSAPVLAAIPAVIVVLRLYPLALRGLLRASARSSRAPAFLGLARASKTALSPALPAFALVLALTVAAFAGMVRDAVVNGEVAASWQTTGADATVTSSATAQSFTISPGSARAVAAVPGVTDAAEVMNESWTTTTGLQVDVLAVDPARYAALVARTSGFPAVPAALLATPGNAEAPQPVLVSPQAAALLGASDAGPVTLRTRQASLQPVLVRVAGVIASTPALPAGGAFVIMPLAAIKSASTPPGPIPVNEMLLTGGPIDRARLAAVLRHALPGGLVTYRSDVLSALTSGPLQHGAFALLTLAIVVAAILGLAVMLLELALGAAEREATLARLATMGLGEGQRAWVVALEVLPAVVASAVAAWACALALPPVLAPDLDLSVFTGSSVAVRLTADAASFALPLAGLAVLAAVALGIQIRLGRRRGATSLRIGG